MKQKLISALLAGALCLSPALAAEDMGQTLTGRDGDTPYLTCGELTATVEDYAEAVRYVGNGLLNAATARGVPFLSFSSSDSSTTAVCHWDNTIDGVTFDTYLAQQAAALAFYRAWSESGAAPSPSDAAFRAWAEEQEASGGYLRFLYIPVEDEETAVLVRDALNEDESRLEALWEEYSLTPELPLEYADTAETFVPELRAALGEAPGQWSIETHSVQYLDTVYGVVKALPLTRENYRELLLKEAWPSAIHREDIRLAPGAEALDAAGLYEDWCGWEMDQHSAVAFLSSNLAQVPEDAVILQAGGAEGRMAPRAGEKEKFPAVNAYPGYGDVKETDWFYDNAKLCYEIGLMTGTDLGFEPGKTLTIGECAAIAARIREALTGDAIVRATPLPGESRPWYMDYVDYIRAVDPTLTPVTAHAADECTRYLFLRLLNAAISDQEGLLASINEVTGLPDSEDGMVLAFYRAGILTGVDQYGTFAGERTLTRAEAAAMVSRIARPELRLPFTPADYAPFAAACLTPDTVMFDTGLTAEEYLITINNAISAWEAALGDDFNWHYVWTDGKSVLNHVKDDSLSALGVTASQGTAAYKDFDVQVYYARLIDLTGETL